METIVADTSFLTTPGSDISVLTGKRVLIAPQIELELQNMLGSRFEEVCGKFQVTPPDYYSIFLSAEMFRLYVEQVEISIAKGLKVAEKFLGPEKPETKKHLREEYREKVRRGLLDSVGDFASICLAKQYNAILATCDLGLQEFATRFGIKTIK